MIKTDTINQYNQVHTWASELILEWGVEEARPEWPRAGIGLLGRGQRAPPHQLGGLRERCKFPQRGPRPTKGFLVF